MKNLTYFKQQARRKRAENRFNAWAATQIDQIFNRMRVSSNARWEQMKADLKKIATSQQ